MGCGFGGGEVYITDLGKTGADGVDKAFKENRDHYDVDIVQVRYVNKTHTLLAPLHSAHASLELLNIPHDPDGLPRAVDAFVLLRPAVQYVALARLVHVEPGGEIVAAAGEDHGAHGAVVRQLGEEGSEVVPHAVREGVEARRPVDEDLFDVGGGGADEVVCVL